MEIHIVKFGQPSQTVEVTEDAVLSEVLTQAGVDSNASIRFRGEQITGDSDIPVQDGETVVVAPPAVSHG